MKSYRKELWFNVPTRRAFINITPQVQECLRESGIKEGFVLCNAMHITAFTMIMRYGWRNLRPMSQYHNTDTMSARTMPTPI